MSEMVAEAPDPSPSLECKPGQLQTSAEQYSAGNLKQHMPGDKKNAPWHSILGGLLGCSLAILATAALAAFARQRRKSVSNSTESNNDTSKHQHNVHLDSDDSSVRIPLKEVIRFKERQWFQEELEAAREGDANAMLRLAKMYLHGQGCPRNVMAAAECLKRARQHGMYCTLDEIWAGDADGLLKIRRELAGLHLAQKRAREASIAAAKPLDNV